MFLLVRIFFGPPPPLDTALRTVSVFSHNNHDLDNTGDVKCHVKHSKLKETVKLIN